MTRWLVLSLLLFQLAPRKASIEGVLLRGATNEPVEDARIEVSGVRADSTRVGPLPLTTGKDGRFSLKDLDAGSYQLTFASNGYVRRSFPAGGRMTVGEGQAMNGLVIRMTATGGVSGRIRDPNGDPVVGVPIQLMQFVYDDLGRRSLQPFGTAQTDQTDDRGEYRLFHITPGKYVLYAGNPWISSYNATRNGSRNDTAYLEAYAYAFYPGVPDARQATAIPVESGSDVRGVDLTLDRPPVYRVRGRLVDLKTGKAPAEAQVRLGFNDPSLGSRGGGEYLAGEKVRYENGSFEFRNVRPGSFGVFATVDTRWASVPVLVGSADLENVLLTIPVSGSIRGRWSADRQPSSASISASIRLIPTSVVPAFGFRLWYDVDLKADGTLEADGVPAGEYRVAAPRSLPQGFYLKESRFGGADALNRPFRFNGDERGSLDVVLGSTAGVVEGTATDGRLEPFPYATIVLMPSRTRDRVDLFKSVKADENGRFVLSNIAPGDYRVFAGDLVDPYAYFDPELFRRSEANGVAVSISESSRRSVNVRVLP
jgi:hypothetical protein